MKLLLDSFFQLSNTFRDLAYSERTLAFNISTAVGHGVQRSMAINVTGLHVVRVPRTVRESLWSFSSLLAFCHSLMLGSQYLSSSLPSRLSSPWIDRVSIFLARGAAMGEATQSRAVEWISDLNASDSETLNHKRNLHLIVQKSTFLTSMILWSVSCFLHVMKYLA